MRAGGEGPTETRVDELDITESSAEARDTGRIEAFSDGVFAIAATLLVLQVAVPESSTNLLRTVLHQWPAFLAYAISFVTILIMWINHNMIMRQIGHADHGFKVLNGALLMAITFVNYPTALLARYLTTPQERDAALIFNGTYVVVALCFLALWRYSAHRGRLLSRQADPRLVAAITRSYRFGPLIYLVATIAAFASVPVSLAINGGLALYWAIFGARAVGEFGAGATARRPRWRTR